MASVKITDLTAYADPAATDVLPIVDVGADVTKKVSIENLLKNASSGTAGAPSIAFDGDSNTGIYRPGADQVAISTSGIERVEFGTSEVVFNDGGENYDFRIEGDTVSNLFFVDASADKVGLGDSSPDFKLDVNGDIGIREDNNLTFHDGAGAAAFRIRGGSDNKLYFERASGHESQMVIDDGKVGVGTTSPSAELHVLKEASGSSTTITISNTGDTNASTRCVLKATQANRQGGQIAFGRENANTWSTAIAQANGYISFSPVQNGIVSERARIDSSGRLLVGTSSWPSDRSLFVVEGNQIDGTSFGRMAVARGAADVANGTQIADIIFADSSQSIGASIAAFGEGTWATNDYPARLVFSTTADGASSPTERMRIDSGGEVTLTQPTSGLAALIIYDSANPNFVIYPNGDVFCGPYAPSVPANVAYKLLADGSATFNGAVSKASGSFRIDHPLKPETHQLVHSFVEGPQADNLYRGKVDLVAGTATVNIDIVAGMTEGTFVALNREVQCFTSNETGWTAVKGSVTGNVLTITAQDNTCSDTISWLVIGERQDKHMYETDWTDENGKVIVEPLKQSEETRSEIPEES